MRKMHYTTELDSRTILITAATAAEMEFDEDGNESFYGFAEKAYDPSLGHSLKMSPGKDTSWDGIIECICQSNEVDECEAVSEEFMADIRNNIKGDGTNGYWLVGIEVEFDHAVLHYASEEEGAGEWFRIHFKKNPLCHIDIEMPDTKARYCLSNSWYGNDNKSDNTGVRIDEDFGYVRRIMTVCKNLADSGRYFLKVTEFAGI